MLVTEGLSQKLRQRFGDDVGGSLIEWLIAVEMQLRQAWVFCVLHRPPLKVREALGEDVVDVLMDCIITVFNRRRVVW